jgi:hypothetical protein
MGEIRRVVPRQRVAPHTGEAGCRETLPFIKNRRPRESGDPGKPLKSLE